MPRANKRPKDPNAPKKSQSSYFIFSNERRPVLQAEGTGTISVTEISKTISSEWKVMDASQKKVYEDRAATLKSEYNIKFEEYKRSDNYRKYQLQLAEWKETSKDLLKSKGKPPKKPKQPESMPKRPQSSYFVFSNERRSQMKDEYPNKKLTELSVIIAGEWKSKTAEEKKYYEEEAAKNKIKYTSEIEEYKKTKEYALFQEKLEEWKVEKKRWDNGTHQYAIDESNQPKISLPRKPKDSKCPKRPLTSYFLYAKEIRASTKLEFPDKPITEIAKEISKKWKVLTEDEKKPYVEEADRLKAAYKITLSEYEGSDAQIQFKGKLQEWKLECDRRKQAAKAKAAKAKINKKKSPKGKGKGKGKGRGSPQKQRRKQNKMDTDSDSDSSSGSYSSSSSGSDSDSSSGSDSDSSSGSSSSSSD